MQLLVEIRIIAELNEALAAEPAVRLEPGDPRRRRDRECSRSALFDLGEFGLFDAFAHDCILAAAWLRGHRSRRGMCGCL